MGVFKNLLGTVLDRFQLGLAGPLIKNDTGAIAVRNAADADYAAVQVALVQVFGDDIELNAGAAGAGADWLMRLVRPDTGMTENIDIILPAGTPSPGQLLRVASFSSGAVALEYYTASEGASNMVLMDSTTLAFGASSPVSLFTKPANALVERIKVIVDTPFDGTNPQLSIGISGTTSKYGAASHIDLTADAGTVFDLDYGLPATGGTEALIGTYSGDGSAAGSARIQVIYVVPS